MTLNESIIEHASLKWFGEFGPMSAEPLPQSEGSREVSRSLRHYRFARERNPTPHHACLESAP